MQISTDTIQFDICPSDPSHICPSLLLLQIPYCILIYNYYKSLRLIIKYKLTKDYDYLDKGLIMASLLCLSTVPLQLIVQTQFIFTCCMFLWYWFMFIIFLKFVIQKQNAWKKISLAILFLYLIYMLLVNYFETNPDISEQEKILNLVIPMNYPIFMMSFGVIIIGCVQLWQIWSILLQNYHLTPSIHITLQNRRTFIIVSGIAICLNRFMLMSNITLRQVLGTVIFIILKDWILMLSVYWCLLYVKKNVKDEIDQISQERVSQNSYMIEMEERNSNRNMREQLIQK